MDFKDTHPIIFNECDMKPFLDELKSKPDPPDYTERVLKYAEKKELEDFRKNIMKDLCNQNMSDMENCEQHSDLWFQSRKHRMTGSIMGGVVGVNPFSNYDQTVKSLVENDFKGNEATKWGNDHEDEACDQYEKSMRLLTTRDNFTVEHRGLVRHPDIPYFGASPDGLITDLKLLLEIKTPFFKRFSQDSS